MNRENKAKVLIYMVGSLGDTIVAIPALRAVRRHFPETDLILLQNVQADHIVRASQVIPENLIDGYVNYAAQAGKFNKIADFYRLRRELRRHEFKAVVYLIDSERPAISVLRDKLFFRSCGIPRLIGFRLFTKAELYPFDEQGRPAMTDNEAVRKLKRIENDGVKYLPDDLSQPFLTFSQDELDSIGKWLEDRRKKKDARLVAIAPGCKTEANVWSLENFIQIGRHLIEQNCELLILGGKAEYDLGEKMISACGAGINAAGQFSVRESGALISHCDFYIGLDTGTTHLAAAVGTKCFALYGERNNPGQWFPLGGGHTIVAHQVECAGCRFYVCPLPSHPCMNGISVKSVRQSLQEFIEGKTVEAENPAVKVFSV